MTIDPAEVITVLRRRAWVVVAATLVFSVVGGVLGMRETREYRATAVLRVGASERETVTEGFETPTREAERYVNPLLSQTELLRSRSLIGDVVDSVGFRLQSVHGSLPPNVLRSVSVTPDAISDTLWLEFDPAGYGVRSSGGAGRAVYGQPFGVNGVEFTIAGPPAMGEAILTLVPREAAVDRLLARLRVSPRPETSIVDVSFRHRDPGTAQLVTNTLVESYRRFEAQFAHERSRRRRIFLQEQLSQADSALARARAALRGFQTRAQTYDARQQLSSRQQNLMMLDIRRGELDADRSVYRGLLEQLASAEGDERWEILRTLVSAPGIAGNPAVARIQEQLLHQRAALDSLTTGEFGAAGTSPDVRRQRQLIATSEAELTGALRSHLAALDARADALDQLAARTSDALASLPRQLAEEARLQQIVATHQDISDQVRGELQRARVAEAATVGQVDIIDLAALPYRPEPGTRIFKVGLGLIFGLMLGAGGVFSLERGKRVVTGRNEIEHTFRLPVLGMIPRATDSDLAELGRRLTPNGTPVEVGRLIENEPVVEGGRGMEAYRLLRTNFLFAGWTSQMRSIVVTSTAPQEGKTLTATSLAASIVEEGARVLLVDGDLWRKRTHPFVDTPQSPGLSDVLSGEASPQDAVRRTGLAGLDFLPRGTQRQDPSFLARGGALSDLLERLGRQYDVLMVDAPPVLAAGSAPVLPAIADGVLMLVRAGRTERDAMREAFRELDTVGARVLGIVLNDPDNVNAQAEGRHYSYYDYAAAL